MKIAIIGKMCSGKSYVADYIVKKYNLEKYSFADKLKSIAVELFGMNHKDRKLLQTIADKMKEIDNDVWVNFLVSQIKHKNNIVIDDVRFVNEYEALDKLGFIFIKLKVDKKTQKERLVRKYGFDSADKQIACMSHNSEIILDLINNADIEIDSNHLLLENIETIVNHLYKQ